MIVTIQKDVKYVHLTHNPLRERWAAVQPPKTECEARRQAVGSIFTIFGPSQTGIEPTPTRVDSGLPLCLILLLSGLVVNIWKKNPRASSVMCTFQSTFVRYEGKQHIFKGKWHLIKDLLHRVICRPVSSHSPKTDISVISSSELAVGDFLSGMNWPRLHPKTAGLGSY